MIDRNLERLLAEAGRDITYPATPDVYDRVLAAIAPEPATGRRPASPSPRGRVDPIAPLGRGSGRGAGARPAFAALVAAVLVVLALTLAVSPSRDAIARLFGVEGSRIEFLPTPPPGLTATPFPTAAPSPTFQPRGSGIFPLDRIEELAGFEPRLPVLDEPVLHSSIVFYGDQAVVKHHYAGFDLWQTKLRPDAGFGKGVPEGGVVEEVDVAGVPGTWVAGAPHYVYYYDERGTAYLDSQRIVERSTLIWRTEAFFYRLETDLPLEDALRIAETLP